MSRPKTDSRGWLSRRILVVGPLLLAVLGLVVTSGHADLVVNGGFESYTGGYLGAPSQVEDASRSLTGAGYTTLTGWTNTGYTYLFGPGQADTAGSYSAEYSVPLWLWGPGAGGGGIPNGLPATSPDGGNYIASDPSYQLGSISQTSITGLTIGDSYTVGFYYAGAQQQGFTGATTEGWQVSLGSDTQSTPLLNNLSQGFTGWQSAALTFTASSTSEVLSFLAIGGPSSSLPPFVLLDGVSVTPTVPEPASLLIWGGILGLGVFVRARRRGKPAAA